MDLATVSSALQEFAGSVERYCRREHRLDEGGAVTAEMRVKRALINMLELDFARDAARFAATYDEDIEVNPSPVSWMREHCHMTSHAAATAVCVGEQAARLADTARAVAEVRVGFAHVGMIAGVAAALDEAGAGSRFDEQRLLARAETLTVQRFRTLCSHVRHEADADAFLRQQELDRDYRTLELRPCGDGVSITGFIDAEGGAFLHAALDPLAVRTDATDTRDLNRRYADALVDLCSRAVDVGDVPRRATQRSHIQVTTSAETLLGLKGRRGGPGGELENGAVIATATVQRLACDATITRVLLDAQSCVIDVGRSQRVVSGATRRALNIRDGGCRWPGCTRSQSWTAAHHIEHWVYGGDTDVENLVLLCRRHHRYVHEGGWQLVRVGDGTIVTVSPLAGCSAPLRAVTGSSVAA